jgi:hypothetical protein
MEVKEKVMLDLYDIMENARIDAEEDIYQLCEESAYAIIQHDVLGGELVITFTTENDEQRFVYVEDEIDVEDLKIWLNEQGMSGKKIIIDLG